ncbi:MAG: CRISPR-associated protein Cas4 [Chloroflexota bacterium]
MLYFALALLLLALFLFWLAYLQRSQTGLPGGRVIYTDTRGWGAVEKPLYDAHLGLTGKPDYIVEKEGQVIPVEVKSGRTPDAPYDSHIYQLASYCLLIEKVYGKRPPYGIIHYPDRDFAVDYTPQLEAAVLDLLAEIRRAEQRRGPSRSHEEPVRCRRCGYQLICEQRLK